MQALTLNGQVMAANHSGMRELAFDEIQLVSGGSWDKAFSWGLPEPESAVPSAAYWAVPAAR